MVVNNARNNFFAHATLSEYQDRQVSGCNLKGHIQRMIQLVRVAHDAVTLLYFLQFRSVHWLTKLNNLFEIAARMAEFLCAIAPPYYIASICLSLPSGGSKRGLRLILTLPFVDLDKQQSNTRPHQLTQSDQQSHEDTRAGRHAQCRYGHQETALAAAQL